MNSLKITLHVPKEYDENAIRSFIKDEITQAGNVKSKETRKTATAGLRKILSAVKPGYSFFTDGADIWSEPYNGVSRQYFCGNEFQPYTEPV